MSDPVSREEVDSILDSILPTNPSAFPSAFSRRGKVPNSAALILDSGPLTAEHVKIAEDHLANGTPTLGVSQQTLKSLRTTHHRAAQLLAGGMREMQVASLCGLHPTRINFLRNHDPAFQELLAYYSSQVEEEFSDFCTAAGALSRDLIDKLREDLDANPEKFTPSLLLDAIRTLADRSGNAPVTKSVSVNVNAGMAEQMRRARERARLGGAILEESASSGD